MLKTGEARSSRVIASLSEVNTACAHVALGAVVCYCASVYGMYALFGDVAVYLEPTEQFVAGIAATALSASLVLRLFLQFSRAVYAPCRRLTSISGVTQLSHVTSLLAAVTSWIFCFAKVPILVDPFTGCRVHLLRWCEWTVLAFVMTFMTEVSDQRAHWSAVVLASKQAVSTACAFFLPLCPGAWSWGAVLLFSFVMFYSLFPAWFLRRAAFVETREFATAARDVVTRVDVADVAARVAFSYYLLSSCICIWSVFVVTFFFAGAAKLSGLDEREAPSWPFCVDAAVDLLAKFLYSAMIVDAHGSLFDSTDLSERRLEELRELMAAVWTASSDALAVSVRHRVGTEGRVRIETSVSPTAEAMLDNAEKETLSCGSTLRCCSAAVVNDRSVPEWQVKRFVYDGCDPAGDFLPTSAVWARGGADDCDARRCAGSAENSGFAELTRRAWRMQDTGALHQSCLLVHKLVKNDGSLVECEATVTHLGQDRLVIVVRDISERVARDGAEKELVAEKAARECDTERDARHEVEKELVAQKAARERDTFANRFMRHEVKNGLLAAIGIADAIHEKNHDAAPFGDIAAHTDEAIERWVGELQTTLTDTLNSVLSEAMARDLVHDTYTPCPELVDIVGLLRNVGLTKNHLRFETSPATFPPVLLDPQLLHCVHRNAVSNACKYGEPDGEVVTVLSLKAIPLEQESTAALPLVPNGGSGGDDENLQSRFAEYEEYEFTLEVVNRPGPQHAKLRVSEQSVQDQVFTQGSRLHPALISVPTNGKVSSVSSGDGGWIMRKCARALGGDCDIRFQPKGTTFTMRCPTRRPLDASPTSIRQFDVKPAVAAPEEKAFELPCGCWGIAIDDSKIQRKLLAKLLSFAGVADDRVSVVGDTVFEIFDFAAMVARHVRKHPDDFHLVIVDENLDIIEESGDKSTVSGSQSIVELRRMLSDENLESKLLAIVRSANDSSADVAVYRSRAHGSLTKLPLKRDRVLETLAPIWLDRFPSAAASP